MTVEARPFPAAAPYRRDKLSPVAATPDPVKALPSTATSKDRLVASRLRIRDELLSIAHPPPKPAFFSRAGSLEDKVKGFVLDLPGVASATDAVQGWWANHPAHQAGVVAGKVSSTLVQPVAREYPRITLAVAGALGAAVILLKPWRWLLRPKVLIGAATQIGASRIKKPRQTSWLSLLASLAKSR